MSARGQFRLHDVPPQPLALFGIQAVAHMQLEVVAAEDHRHAIYIQLICVLAARALTQRDRPWSSLEQHLVCNHLHMRGLVEDDAVILVLMERTEAGKVGSQALHVHQERPLVTEQTRGFLSLGRSSFAAQEESLEAKRHRILHISVLLQEPIYHCMLSEFEQRPLKPHEPAADQCCSFSSRLPFHDVGHQPNSCNESTIPALIQVRYGLRVRQLASLPLLQDEASWYRKVLAMDIAEI